MKHFKGKRRGLPSEVSGGEDVQGTDTGGWATLGRVVLEVAEGAGIFHGGVVSYFGGDTLQTVLTTSRSAETRWKRCWR